MTDYSKEYASVLDYQGDVRRLSKTALKTASANLAVSRYSLLLIKTTPDFDFRSRASRVFVFSCEPLCPTVDRPPIILD